MHSPNSPKKDDQLEILQLLLDFDMISHLDISDLIEHSLAFIVDRVGVESLSISRYEAKTDTIRFLGAHDQIVELRAGTLLARGETRLFDVVDRQAAIYRSEIGVDEVTSPLAEKLMELGFQSDFLVPLLAEGRCIGTLNVASREPDGISEQTRSLLVLIAPRLAQALHNAWLHHSLARRKAQLAEAQAIGQVGSFFWDVEANLIRSSREAQRIHGWPSDAPIRFEELLELVHPDDRAEIRNALETARDGDVIKEHEYRVVGDGTQRRIHVRIKSHHENGRLVYLSGTVQDVTERRAAELELRLTRDAAEEASRIKSQFLSSMSHEIRTPMNAIIGFADLVLDTRLDDEQREFLDSARAAANQLMGIFDQLLEFSEISSGGVELENRPFSLHDLVEDLIRRTASVAAERGLTLTSHVGEEVLGLVVGDPDRLRQVLLNLLDNAIKFTEEGEVVLTVESSGEGEKDANLHFMVSDTGIGVPESQQAEIFESFTQGETGLKRRFGGSGLGLTLSCQLVALMGGKIRLVSPSNPNPDIGGPGSIFHFALCFGEPRKRDASAGLPS